MSYISSVAALCATRLNPDCREWICCSAIAVPRPWPCTGAGCARRYSHCWIWACALGEGSGRGGVAVPLLRTACALAYQMATCRPADVSGKQTLLIELLRHGETALAGQSCAVLVLDGRTHRAGWQADARGLARCWALASAIVSTVCGAARPMPTSWASDWVCLSAWSRAWFELHFWRLEGQYPADLSASTQIPWRPSGVDPYGCTPPGGEPLADFEAARTRQYCLGEFAASPASIFC